MITAAAAAFGADAPPDLEPLIEWCRLVLIPQPNDLTEIPAPPFPEHVLDPAARLGLDPVDLAVLAICLGPDLDARIGEQMSTLVAGRGSGRPNAHVLADLLDARGANRTALAFRVSRQGPLTRLGLIDTVGPRHDGTVTASTSSFVTPLICTPALIRWVMGMTGPDQDLEPYVRLDGAVPMIAPRADEAQSLVLRLLGEEPSLTLVAAETEAAAHSFSLWSAAATGRPTLEVMAAALVDRTDAARVAAEAALRHAVVVLIGDVRAVPVAHLEPLEDVVVVGTALPPRAATSLSVTRDIALIRVSTEKRQTSGVDILTRLRASGIAIGAEMASHVATWEHLGPSAVDDFVATALATVRGRTTSPTLVRAQDLTELSLLASGGPLAHYARAVPVVEDWDRLTVSGDVKGLLMDLCHQAARRSSLSHDAGFRHRDHSTGLTALLAGPSGTGKTLAARLIAGELCLPLFRVDLARVVSKYIGETERNLEELFDAAEKTDAILLFDEAESLFTRRTEVHDAHDRYANLEVAYLLQRLEAYQGLALMTTNLPGYLDTAFLRRFAFIIHFEFPSAAQRALLWRSVWPEGVNLSPDIDLDRLASGYPLSGAHIDNIAWAACASADEPGRVEIGDLHRAIGRELIKLGGALDDSLLDASLELP